MARPVYSHWLNTMSLVGISGLLQTAEVVVNPPGSGVVIVIRQMVGQFQGVAWLFLDGTPPIWTSAGWSVMGGEGSPPEGLVGYRTPVFGIDPVAGGYLWEGRLVLEEGQSLSIFIDNTTSGLFTGYAQLAAYGYELTTT